MPILTIADGEGGASVRSKLNQSIGAANEVEAARSGSSNLSDRLDVIIDDSIERDNDLSADIVAEASARGVAIAAATDPLIGQAYERPGDAKLLYSSTLTGSAASRPPLTVGTIVNDTELGAVLRISGADVPGASLAVARRIDFAFDPARTYLVYVVIKRLTDSSDPLNNGVEVRLQNLNYNKASVSNIALGAALSPTVAGGALRLSFLIGKAGAPGDLDYTIPPTSLYGVPYVLLYGSDHATAIATVDIRDVTDQVAGGADISEIIANVSTLSDDLAAEVDRAVSRDDELETEITDINGSLTVSSDEVMFQALSSTGGAVIEVGADARIALPASTGKLSRLPRPEVIDRLDATGWDDYSGTLETYPGTIPTAALTFIRKEYLSSTILGIVGFGQSLAGSAADNLADVAITTAPIYPDNALMPFVGRKPQGVTFDTLVPAYEWTGTLSNSTTESWATGMMNLIIATMQTKLSVAPTLVTATFSQGSRTWPQLGPGNEVWDHFAKGIRDLQRSAEKRGKRFEVMMVPILWGEQNRVIGLNADTIRTHYLSMVRHIKALVMDITGQKMPPLIVISVPANSNAVPDVDQPHITVPASLHGVEGIHVLNPNYIRETTSNVHLVAQGYKDLGEDLARVALEGWFGPGYCPLILRPDRIRWTDSTHFILPCSMPTPPVVVDLTGTVVTPPTWGKAGFQLFDGRTAAEITISTITAVGGSGLEGDPLINLEFALGSAPTGAPRLTYAVRNDGTGNNAGNVSGARGCIRDSSPSPRWALPIYATIPAY